MMSLKPVLSPSTKIPSAITTRNSNVGVGALMNLVITPAVVERWLNE